MVRIYKTMEIMKAYILIPSYNEEQTIGGIIREIKERGHDIVVVDDGSTDDTGKVAAQNGATVIRHAENLGKGASLKYGFDYLLGLKAFDAVIIMDGDGQHSPADIQKFISHAREHSVDIIVGNRMRRTKNMPFIRMVTNRLMSLFLSIMCKQNIPDTQCGFKLIKRRVLEAITLESKNYDFDSEVLILASKKHFKISSVPIDTIYKGELSYINPLKDTFRFIGLIIKTYFAK